ncbi:copper resistance CopC/CopD family protein [Streptomyces sp. NPDC001595]|uniref:copper resistance CopC/CopD family protein n=1 Tax=Streptomyces sp. NPDC001532 TaxID=3154520 RepID=UPI003323945C
MHEGVRLCRRPALTVVLLILFLLGPAAPASAHAALGTTDPRDGSVLPSAPRHLTLGFTESVGLLEGSVRLFGPDGRRTHLDEPRHLPGGDDTIRVTVPGELGTGTYTVAWRVVSADSHPVSGAFTFSVGEPSRTTAAPDTGPAEHPATKALHTLARHLSYLAAALLLGTAAFIAVCRPPHPRPLRRPLMAGWWTLFAATVALLLLRAPYEAGTAPWTALDPAGLARTLTGRPGVALLCRLALLLVLALLPRRRTPAVLAAGATLAVGLALTWAGAEHASAGIQVPVAITSSVLHLLAMAAWLGGLAALLLCLRHGALPTAAVTRYSRLAFLSVTVLAITGVYQSWRGLGSLDALTRTSYGRLLLAKLAAVILLLAVARISRRLVRTRVAGRAVVRERVPEPAGAARVGEPAGAPRTETAVRAVATVGALGTAAAVVAVGKPPAGASPPGPPQEPKPGPGPDPEPSPSPSREPEQEAESESGPESESESGPESESEPEPEASPEPHRRALCRSVLAELAVAMVVLLLTTLLTGTPPSRAVTEAAAGATGAGASASLPPTTTATVPYDTGTPGGRGTVQITLDPARTGENSVQAVVFAPDGGLVTVPELRLSLTLDAQDIGPIDARLADRGGYWATDTLDLPVAGTWTMKVTVRVSEFDQVTVARPVRVT